MDLIEQFMSRYTQKFDFYSHASRLAAEILRTDLQAAGVRCIVTNRAKDIHSLRLKCRQRDSKQPYQSVEAITDTIVDLAGVRVALYFPADGVQVDKIVKNKFHEYDDMQTFPKAVSEDNPNGSPPFKRFSGYNAVHYRAQLLEKELGEDNKGFDGVKIEIQVATLLMHAWSEVEHDLAYKPISDRQLSEAEYALLDQLNGLVIAGEIALEALQRAGEARISEAGRKFQNHYELAAYLLSKATELSEDPVSDSGLGRVNVLFIFLSRLGVGDTVQRLSPYLETLHGQLEVRPLAEQIIDALLVEDPSRLHIYLQIQEGLRVAALQEIVDRDLDQQKGRFLTSWATLEILVRDLARARGDARGSISPVLALRRLDLLDSSRLSELEKLRIMRNQLVHGKEVPTREQLAQATLLLDSLVGDLPGKH